MPTNPIDRRQFVERSLLVAVASTVASSCSNAGAPNSASNTGGNTASDSANAPSVSKFEFDEVGVAELQSRMTAGTLTSHALTSAYLKRIDEIDAAGPTLKSVIERNPDALTIADAMDAERKAGKVRGPLHGIPVLIKDNIDSADKMMTTAGSWALAGAPAPRDSHVVERLRAAGAVLLGKTNLSEWANFRSTRASSGWSGRGGQTRNPYVIDRNPCGSSAGTGAAIAANLATIGVGTETDGSIICPSSICGLVGIKPTVGLVSRSGIIPISATQDTAGPMCRTVADAAVLLGVLAGEDERDAATKASAGHVVADYTKHLDANALKGARIGVARNISKFHPMVDVAFEKSIEALKAAGAEIVDSADLPTLGKFDEAEMEVLLYEFKEGLNAYLKERAGANMPRTLAELIEFNKRETAKEMPWFAQELFERAEAKGPLTDAKYIEARAKCDRLARVEGIDAVINKHKLDAIVSPSNGPSWPIDLINGDHYTGGNTSFAAVARYPSITVPMGFAGELPLGISFTGTAWSEARLIALGYAFEQATKVRHAPKFLATAPQAH